MNGDLGRSMARENPNGWGNPNVHLVYTELCNSYRAIDQFRGVLLGALPLASGTGIYLSIKEFTEPASQSVSMLLGFFGFFITLGLFIFEVYGIRKCTHLIVLGKHLEEKQLGIRGQFSHRPKGVEGFGWLPKSISPFVNEPLAASVIYPAVLGAWVFLVFRGVKLWLFPLGVSFAAVVFLVGCGAMYQFNRWLEVDAKNLTSILENAAQTRQPESG